MGLDGDICVWEIVQHAAWRAAEDVADDEEDGTRGKCLVELELAGYINAGDGGCEAVYA